MMAPSIQCSQRHNRQQAPQVETGGDCGPSSRRCVVRRRKALWPLVMLLLLAGFVMPAIGYATYFLATHCRVSISDSTGKIRYDQWVRKEQVAGVKAQWSRRLAEEGSAGAVARSALQVSQLATTRAAAGADLADHGLRLVTEKEN